MKVIQVVEKLDIGGLEKIALDLSNYFAKNHQVVIISLQSFDRKKLENWVKLDSNIKIISLNKSTKKMSAYSKSLNLVKMILKMRKEIKIFKPDVIHTHHIGPLFYSVLSTCINKIKIVHTEHDIWYLEEEKNLKLRRKLCKIKPHKTIALTHEMEKELNTNYKIKNTTTVFNGINVDKLKEVSDAKDQLGIKEDFVIGTCGRIETVKNHKYLLEQAEKLKEIRFLIAGNGSLLEDLKKKAPSNVTFLGHQNDLSLFFSAIDIFCLPSKNEGLPLSILEAYFYNKPVFSTDVGNIKEIICDKDYFFNTNNNLDIQKMKELNNINMKEKIKKYFSLNSMAENYLLNYKE